MAEDPPSSTNAAAIDALLAALWDRLEQAIDRSTLAKPDLRFVACLCDEIADLARAAAILAGRSSAARSSS
jgi:hypothetical protein